MITKQQYDVICARLDGMASEAEMKRQFAAARGHMSHEYSYLGERRGLLKALDLLQHNGHDEVQKEKEQVMGNGCE